MKEIFAAILVLAFPAFIVYSCIPLSLEEYRSKVEWCKKHDMMPIVNQDLGGKPVSVNCKDKDGNLFYSEGE